MTMSLIAASPRLDKNATTLIGITAGTAALMISNFDQLANSFYVISEIKMMIIILICSLLCGFAQKFCAAMCEINILHRDEFTKKLFEAMDEYDKEMLDLAKTAEE